MAGPIKRKRDLHWDVQQNEKGNHYGRARRIE
jgi:hypothetical protein